MSPRPGEISPFTVSSESTAATQIYLLSEAEANDKRIRILTSTPGYSICTLFRPSCDASTARSLILLTARADFSDRYME